MGGATAAMDGSSLRRVVKMTFEYSQTNTTRHNLYRYFWDMVPWFQFLTKPSEAHAINDTDRPNVLAYE